MKTEEKARDGKLFVSGMMEAISIALVNDLKSNWRKYDITKKEDLDILNDKILLKAYEIVKKVAKDMNLK